METIEDLSTLEIIYELENRYLSGYEKQRIKELLGYYNDDNIDNDNEIKSLDEVRKLEVIMENLKNKTYLEICSFFEGPLPFEK